LNPRDAGLAQRTPPFLYQKTKPAVSRGLEV
jgi:hypothetical protein